MTRRDRGFLLLVLSATISVHARAQSRHAGVPDMILTGGKVFTADSLRPWASAVAIRGDRIVAVGDDATVERMAGARTRRIVLGGRVVIPGFNDAHTHISASVGGTSFVTGDSPMPDPPLAVVLDSVAAIARRTPPGTWISTDVAETVLGDTTARRTVLDKTAPNHPVYLHGWSGHGAVMNSAALQLVSLDAGPDPVGGWLERDAHGRPTGRIDEYALFSAEYRLMGARSSAAVRVFKAYNAEAAAFGITSAQNMSTGITPAILADVERAGVLQLRHHVIPFEMTRVGGRNSEWRDVRGTSPLTRIAGAKWVLDGTPIERLALMREPYADRAGWYGRANFPFDTLKAMLREALARKQQPMLHAVGDSTIALVFAAMRAVAPDSVWRRVRPRLEHADNLMRDQFATAKALGIVVVQNPSHLSIVFRGNRWSDDRATRSEALRDIVEAGIPVAIGSDGPTNPGLNVMFATVNPANPPQALSREQAVIAYTRTAAYAEHAERDKGTLRAGMLADLAVLSQDLFTMPTPALPSLTSVLTLVGGRVTHNTLDRPSAPAP